MKSVRKANKTLPLRVTDFDQVLLAYLKSLTGGSQASIIRDALRFFAQHHPRFDARMFTRFVQREWSPRVKKKQLAEALLRDVERFVQSLPDTLADGGVVDAGDHVEFDSAADFGG